jgi:hypothetical protein
MPGSDSLGATETKSVSGNDGGQSPPQLRPRTLDFAVLITLGTGALYFLAWKYWDGYLSFFGLDTDFMQLRVENIVGAVWAVAVAYGFLLLQVFGQTLNAPRLSDASIPAP